MSLGEATALGAADGNHDDDGAEGRDDLGYVHGVGDVLEILNDEERVAFERDDQQFYTLQQLQEMPNAPTARMIIANNCYLIAVICKFVALRLHNSHGCPHPRIFSAETREFIQKVRELFLFDCPVFLMMLGKKGKRRKHWDWRGHALCQRRHYGRRGQSAGRG